MSDLFQRLCALYGEGLEFLFSTWTVDSANPREETVEEKQDEDIVVRVDAKNGLRFAFRALYQKCALPPSKSEGWGSFFAEDEEDFADLGPKSALAVFSQNDLGIILTGVAVVLNAVPAACFTDLNGDSFDPWMAPWVSFASDDFFGGMDDEASPFFVLVKTLGDELRDCGYVSFFTVVEEAESKSEQFGRLPARAVASVQLNDKTLTVLEVSLRFDDDAMRDILKRFLSSHGLTAPGGKVVYGAIGMERKSGADCLIVYVDAESDRESVPTKTAERVPVVVNVIC